MYFNELDKEKINKNMPQFEYVYTYNLGDILKDNNKELKNKYKRYVRVKCKYCGLESDKIINSTYGCKYCCNKYENSFAYHIEQELKQPLDKYWNYKYNTLNPYYIYKNSHEKVYLNCQNKNWHIYKISPMNFVNGKRCGYCNSKGNGDSNYFDSLGFLYNEIAKMIANDKRNNIDILDTYKISCSSNKKYYIKCKDCGYESDKQISINHLTQRGFRCQYCKDGKPITEKFMINILNMNKINFKTELNHSDFNWIVDKRRYDIFLPDFNWIIEIHGLQHYNSKISWNTYKSIDQKEIDKFKENLAKKNGINEYIILDFRKTEYEYMVKSLKESKLNNILDLNENITKTAFKNALKSNTIIAYKLFNQGLSKDQIAKKLNLSRKTINDYLNKMNSCL